jgi:pyruvate-formate lyase-activating enzyme
LRTKEDAPAGWRRTERFALGLAADPAGKSALALYRAVLATVRNAEAAFAWQETTPPSTRDTPPAEAGAAADSQNNVEAAEYARRARAAEGELDLHLDHTPFVELDVAFDRAAALAEAMTLIDRFVVYQSDPEYGVQGWRGLALQALDGDASRVATTDDDAGIYRDQSRYRLTDVAALCPVTMSLLERLIDFEQCRTVSFLLLEPGARITVHVDGEGPPVIRSVNVALNMPAECRLVIDCNADGSDNAYTRTVPFRDGSAFLLNVAKYHYVVNDSDEPRIHVVARGSLRQPVLDLLALAEAQDGMAGTAAVEAALDIKRRELGETRPAGGSTDAATATGEPTIPSPFISTLADAACQPLLALLDLGDRVLAARVGPASNGANDWQVEVDVRLPSGDIAHLDFEAAEPDRPAWFRTAHLACSYRVDGADPLADRRNEAFLRDLRERLTRIDPPGGTVAATELAELFAALDRYRPFLPVQDKDYCIVFRGGPTPVGILWLGFRCNQDCRICWQGRDWPAPPDEVFDRWIDELCAAGVSSLIFSGGEPTLHPRLPEWLRRAARAGVPVTLETNAIRFTEPGFLEELRDAGLKSAVISLHSADPDVSDAMTMTPGSFARTVAGTRAALAAGLDVGVHCVVERANVGGLEEHARFVALQLCEGGRTVTHVSYSFPIGYRRRELYSGAIAPLDEVRPRLSAAVRTLREREIYVSFLGTSGFTPCAYDEPGALAATLPEQVTEEMREGRVFVACCSACSLRRRCLGVHEAYVEQHGDRGVTPVP